MVAVRALRAAVLMLLGLGAILLASADPARALGDPAFYLLGAAMLAWTMSEAWALRQDEPADYAAKRNTRLLQATLLLTGAFAALDRYRLGVGPLPRTVIVAVAGALLVLTGGALRVAAIRTLDAHFRYELRVEAGQRIVERGVFRRIRHPSYLGLLLISLGEAVALASLLAAVVGGVVLLALLVVRMRAEERVMLASFGESYRDYQSRTWRLLPPLY